MAKIKLDDFVRYGQLFEIYGRLLSSDRQKIMTDYFEFNMTLAEIASSKSISRQAVLDAISKSCEKLEEFENALGCLKKNVMLQNELSEISKIASTNNDKKIYEKVENLLRKI